MASLVCLEVDCGCGRCKLSRRFVVGYTPDGRDARVIVMRDRGRIWVRGERWDRDAAVRVAVQLVMPVARGLAFFKLDLDVDCYLAFAAATGVTEPVRRPSYSTPVHDVAWMTLVESTWRGTPPEVRVRFKGVLGDESDTASRAYGAITLHALILDEAQEEQEQHEESKARQGSGASPRPGDKDRRRE